MNDRFAAGPTGALMTFSSGWTSGVTSFDAVNAYATAGGIDVARLYDSAGDDGFYATPTEGGLWGTGFYNRVESFDQVLAYATAGGSDTANLYGSSGDETFYGTPTQGALWLPGGGWYNRAMYFDVVHAHLSQGGDEEVVLDDSAGDDLLEADDDWLQLFSDDVVDFLIYLDGLDSQLDWAEANSENGGNDTTDIIPLLDYDLDLDGPWS